MDPHRALAALGEPNRLRIVELLAAAPRTVGEIAQTLDLRQPQTTKHLQTLESADLVVVHRLGKRRVAALQRDTLLTVAERLAGLGVANPSESVLEQYERVIRVEELRLAEGETPAGRTYQVSRTVAAPIGSVWRAWTTADQLQRWWSPEHFEVADCEVEAIVGGRLTVTIKEADGTHYSSAGEVLAMSPGRAMTFTQAPLDGDGSLMFMAVHDLVLEEAASGTTVSLTIRIQEGGESAGAALAGIPIGWAQCFDKLAALLEPA